MLILSVAFENMEKIKDRKNSKSSNSGMARVALYRDPLMEGVQDVGIGQWGDGFYDFSRPVRMLSHPTLIDGQYDKGFFYLSDKYRGI